MRPCTSHASSSISATPSSTMATAIESFAAASILQHTVVGVGGRMDGVSGRGGKGEKREREREKAAFHAR